MTRFLFILLALCAFGQAAHAEGMKYIPDPVYHSFDPEEPSPMQDMIDLANGGDVRAQYILGDLYSKGKGGLAKDEKQGAQWFEMAAKNGYFEAFIRLAALAKDHDRTIEAYKWYSLAINYFSAGPWRKHAETARDELAKDAKLTPADLDEARKDANIWRADLRREKEEQAEQERQKKRAAEDAEAAAKKSQEKKP